MDADAVFLDTNVLLYASRPAAPHYSTARAKLQALDLAGQPMWISTQVLREYFAVATRQQAAHGAIDAAAALRDIQGFEARFEVAQETPAVFRRLIGLLASVPIGGRQVHDANIVATMLKNGVSRLATFNVRDFQRFTPAIQLDEF